MLASKTIQNIRVKSSAYPIRIYKMNQCIRQDTRQYNKQYNKHDINNRTIKTQASLVETLEYSSYIIGKGIIVFTMFYCSLNWLHYKNLREQNEKDNKNKDKDNDNDKK